MYLKLTLLKIFLAQLNIVLSQNWFQDNEFWVARKKAISLEIKSGLYRVNKCIPGEDYTIVRGDSNTYNIIISSAEEDREQKNK